MKSNNDVSITNFFILSRSIFFSPNHIVDQFWQMNDQDCMQKSKTNFLLGVRGHKFSSQREMERDGERRETVREEDANLTIPFDNIGALDLCSLDLLLMNNLKKARIRANCVN